MIEFNELKFRNFLSYGHAWTPYYFEKGITRIAGINGQGKSTIVDAIYYALFGKPFRKINIPQLVNSRNRKDLCVELSFTSNQTNFKIIRGIKPDRFEVYKDNELLPQNADKKLYQEMLEDTIGCNEDIFLQIGIKSLTRYGSFLTLPKGRKREIIEDIFGLQVLSEMWEANKLEADEIEQTIHDLRQDESNTELLIEQEKKNLENLKRIKQQMKKNIAAENAKLNKKLEAVKEVLKKLFIAEEFIEEAQKELTIFESQIQAKQKEAADLEKLKNIYQTKMELESEKITFVQSYCNTCPNIDKMKKGLNIDKLSHKISSTAINLNELTQEISHLNVEATKLRNKTDKQPELTVRIEAIQREMKNINTSFKDEETTSIIIDETNYKKYRKQLENISQQLSKENENLRYNRAIYLILSDDGIKSFIIKKYLPLLNKLMNTYLQKFMIDLELEFDSELEIQIRTKFKEKYSYDSFSEGEKKRIDAAMMFTFLEFCKMKHSNNSMNLLILDEFPVGLDTEGENAIHEIMKDIVEKEDKEIITISPNPRIDPDRIDRLFYASMNKGFSQLELSSV